MCLGAPHRLLHEWWLKRHFRHHWTSVHGVTPLHHFEGLTEGGLHDWLKMQLNNFISVILKSEIKMDR